MEMITRQSGDFYGIGGLALIWDRSIDLRVTSYSSHHIDSTVQWHG